MKHTKSIILAIMLFSILFLMAGCKTVQKEPIQSSAYLLNTTVSISIYDSTDQTIIEEAFELCKSYEQQFSRTIPTSDISKMNNRQPEQDTFPLTPDMEALLEKGMYYSELSDGAFDMTIAPISSLWNFKGDSPRLPDEAAIVHALPSVDYHNIVIQNHQITFLSPDTKIDLGAIAKGYIADKLKEFLLEKGVKSAIINLGGNVLCIGAKPDGSPFKVGLQKPFENRNETVEVIDIRDVTVVSSGVYERHFFLDSVNYHHLLDPKTGYPFDNGLLAVTIITEYSVDGDGLSTSAFALGLEEGLNLIDKLPDTYAVFITEDGTLHYSEGAKDLISK